MPDYALIRQLLTIAHEVSPPDTDDDQWGDKTFDHPSGWKVVIFYDCGDLDYIDNFVTPDGETIGLWGDEVDPRIETRGEDDIYNILQSWRGCDDTARLLDMLPA